MPKPKKDKYYSTKKRKMFALLEIEVRMIEVTKRDLQQAREDILHSKNYTLSDSPRGTDISDNTGNTAIRLVSNSSIRDMESTIYAIDRAIREFPHGDRLRLEFIEEAFFKRTLTPKGIIGKLFISEATYWRWRDEFLNLVALYKGWRV